MATGCPGFGWTEIAGASGYELVVYEVGSSGSDGIAAAEPMLRVEVPAGGSWWTPELGECLPPGRYGWAVGAIVERAGKPQKPRWSRPAVFRVEGGEQTKKDEPSPRPWTASQTVLSRAVVAEAPREGPGLRVATGEAYAPPLCVAGGETFADVPASDPFCRWIEQLARDGIAADCGAGNFCPDNPVSRKQLAMALERSMRGTATWSPDQGAGALTPPAGNSLTTVDDPVNAVGQYTSITIGADGLPVIAYYDSTADALQVAHCNDVACAGQDETITTVDDPPANSVGGHAAIAIGADGLPVISYHDHTALALKVAHCNDLACAGQDETITTVDDPANEVGYNTSIAIGADGLPIISYRDVTAAALRVTHCDDVACAPGGETTTLVDDAANSVGQFTSIAVGADGLPIVSYYDATAGNLKVAHCDDVACAPGGETITTVDPAATVVGFYTSIAIGIDGLPIISYQDATAGNLKVVHCNDTACAPGGESVTTVDASANVVGLSTSLTIGSDGLPVISYFDDTAGTLKVAHCNDLACAGQDETITTVDDPANLVGLHNAITVGVDGLPIISYRDNTAYALKVAHCSNVFCAPFFRRR